MSHYIREMVASRESPDQVRVVTAGIAAAV